MADKDVATGTWLRALVGIAMALVLTMGVSEAMAKSPAHGAPGAEKGRKLGASNGQKVRSHGSAPTPTKSHGRSDEARSKPNANRSTSKPVTPNSHAKAGKTTICHSTGSSTNPYVEITISNNALPAHARHHDGRDIIPAPAEGCESGAAQGVADETGAEDAEGGVLGRRRANRTADDVETADKPRKHRATDGLGGVLGAAESNIAPANAAQPVAEEEDDGGSLPFTGFVLGAVLLIGTVALAVGTALRRASRSELD